MPATLDDEVIVFAKENFKILDCLAEVYSFQIIWTSENLSKKLGYENHELDGTSIRKLLSLTADEFLKISISLFDGKPNKKTLLCKNGEKISATGVVHSFMYKNCPFIAISNVVYDL
jgi:hypothetical protein